MRYKTQMQAAKQGVVTPEMALVAKKERRDAQYIMILGRYWCKRSRR